MIEIKFGLGDDGLPPVPSKAQLAEATVLFVVKYRAHFHLLPTESLTLEQVEQVVDGFRQFIYQYEEIRPRKK